MEHVFVVGLEISFDVGHGSKGLIDIVHFVTDLGDSQVHLLLAEFRVDLDNLVEVSQAVFKLTLLLLDES